ncbi:Peptidase family M4 [uncultured virus]|nr:Peptidase family M4 [uncultured virus]
MPHHCYFVPKHLEDRIHSHNRDISPKTPSVSDDIRERRRNRAEDATLMNRAISAITAKNHVFNAKNRRRQPGTLIASSMNEATTSKDLDAVGAWVLSDYFLRFCREVLVRASFDGANGDIISTIHYYTKYNNAFFDGDQMVYGDGDGTVFEDFSQDPSVVFHELWHGVTDRTCGLVYQDQSGALNESLSDVFASIIMQWMNGETIDQASWLIGERCVIDISRMAYALRSLADPGTAFVKHPYMGTDDQPQDMDHYDRSPDDNGQVHKNSGIPNHAFYLFAKSVGGYAWNVPCKIWFKTITTPGLISPNATFSDFAQGTLSAATELYASSNPGVVEKLRKAWQMVKVI